MRVLLLCDGGGRLGVGHVIRSLALAEAAVAAGHQVVVAGRFEGSFVQSQLAAAGVEVDQLTLPVADGDPRTLVGLVDRVGPDVLHVDSYGAPRRIAELVGRGAGDDHVGTVLSNMEDGSFGRRPADVVIDPTLGSDLSPRPDDGSRWLLRGSRFTPVRRRVMDACKRSDDHADDDTAAGERADRTVLVVMGGTDPVGLAPAVVDLLARTGLPLQVTVIALGENAELVHEAAAGSHLSVQVLAPVDDLAAIMARQDLVISAAGTSVSELCCIGVPMALVWAVQNQREGYDRIVAAGAALGLGGPELGALERNEQDRSRTEGTVAMLRRALTDSHVRADLVRACRHIVDGLGAWRVVRTWEQAVRLGSAARPVSKVQESSALLTVRPAGLHDARRLWEWRNDLATRASSRSSDEVTWDEHLRWLTASLARDDRVLLVAEDPVGPVGTVRWDLEFEGEWEVSITVAPDRRGGSLARPLLRKAETALSEVSRSTGASVTAYLAVVNVGNGASIRLFESSAYLPDLPPDPGGFMRFRKAAPVA